VLEHGARGDLAETLALEAEAGHEAVDGRREHVLVRSLGIRGIRAGERDPISAHDHRLVHDLNMPPSRVT
jgi:hypothetical protein